MEKTIGRAALERELEFSLDRGELLFLACGDGVVVTAHDPESRSRTVNRSTLPWTSTAIRRSPARYPAAPPSIHFTAKTTDHDADRRADADGRAGCRGNAQRSGFALQMPRRSCGADSGARP